MYIERNEKEIDSLESWAGEALSSSHYPGMTYEEGVMDTLNWILGRTKHSPADD